MENNLPVTQKQEDKPDPFLRHPIMLTDGSTFVLSEREKCVCETFIRTNGNIAECTRVLNAKFHKHYRPTTIRTWLLKRKLVSAYMKERGIKIAEIRSFTADEWKHMGLEVLKGKRKFDRVQAQIWRDLGQIEFEKQANAGTQMNTQINIYQANGKS